MSEVFVDHFGHALGDVRATVEEAVAGGHTVSDAPTLRDAGFEQHYRCGRLSAYELACGAVRDTGPVLTGIGAIVYVTCLPASGSLAEEGAWREGGDVKPMMDFPACHLQADFGLEGAQVIGLNQQACAGLLGSMRLAGSLLATDAGLQRVLCVAADRFPNGARYEQGYNLMSDGATACIVSRERAGFRLLGWHGVFNGGLARVSDDEAAGTFFGYSHRVITECVARAGRRLSDVDWIVPQNMNRRAWGILARLLGYDAGRVLFPTLGEVGHLVCGDNLLNLERLVEAGIVHPGHTVLLFMAGYGLNWQCVLLERQ